MIIPIDTVAIVGKSITVKVEKDDKKEEHRICHLKLERMQVNRSTIDALLGRVDGWAARCLFDELGAPLAWLTLGVDVGRLEFSGSIVGNIAKGERLGLESNVTVANVTLELRSLGALLSAEFSWPAAGDELSDVDPLLGQVCSVRGGIVRPDPGELFERPRCRAERDQLADNVLESNARLEDSLVSKFRRTTTVVIDGPVLGEHLSGVELRDGDSLEVTSRETESAD